MHRMPFVGRSQKGSGHIATAPAALFSSPANQGIVGLKNNNFLEEPMNKRIMSKNLTRRGINAGIGAALISPALTGVRAFAQGGDPIKIGFGMALTGPLAVNGPQA